MKYRWPFACVALVLALTCGSRAQDEKQAKKSAEPAGKSAEAKPAAKSDAAAAVDAELAAIRGTEREFKKAFDAGDAKAVAALWTTNGEYVDEVGRRLQGREAIEKEFATFFTANKGAKITSHIESLRLINAETAIEDGSDVVEPAPAGA